MDALDKALASIVTRVTELQRTGHAEAAFALARETYKTLSYEQAQRPLVTQLTRLLIQPWDSDLLDELYATNR